MSYYRKYRPQKFASLIGQDHIRQTLANALQNGSFSHAYLFSGPKGSGKTSTARLLAKALNCQGRKLGPDAFEPCNKCISCQEITLGSSLDIAEIDAASNRGIDEMRDLREKIRFAPTAGRYKVYIIDECHMLTKEAFNALLKTLEEPPAHAIFILATTEIHKVPATVLSRTQSFEFKKADISEMMKLLNHIVKKENLQIEPAALRLIARLSFGAYRDGLSMLDQVASLSGEKSELITLAQTQAVLGQTAEGLAWEFAAFLAQNERQNALKMTEKVYFEGKDLENFVSQVITIFRKVMLLQTGLISEFEASKDEREKLTQMAADLSLEKIVQIIEKLSETSGKLKALVLGQLPLEMAVVELTSQTTVYGQRTTENSPQSTDHGLQTTAEVRRPKSVVQFTHWPAVILEVKKQNNTLAALLGGAQVREITSSQINLVVRFKFHADQICNKKNCVIIEAAILQVTGTPKKIDCIVDKDLEIKKPLGAEEEVLNSAKEVFEVDKPF